MAQGDILVSPAWLWYGPEGEPLPDINLAVGVAWGGNWEWMGLTLEGLANSVETDTFEVDVQQITAPIMQSITGETFTLTTSLAEHRADLLQILDGGNITVTPPGAAQVGYTELRAGGRTQRTVYSVGFETRHPLADGTLVPLRVFFHRATFARGGAVNYAKGDVAGLPIEITVLGDETQAADEQVYVYQRVTSLATG